MDLFFSPLACSLASRISSYEAGIHLNFIEVDPVTKRTRDGRNYLEFSPLGLVPALRLDDGFLLTGNAAILEYFAASSLRANLAPLSTPDLAKLHQWLFIVGTELHKVMFVPLFDKKIPEGTQTHARDFVFASLDFLDAQLTGRQFLLDRFTTADAYLCSILNWAAPTRIDLSPWPSLKAYHERLLERPSVSKAMAEEEALYEAEVMRYRAA
jgi:glutathione S-transferase